MLLLNRTLVVLAIVGFALGCANSPRSVGDPPPSPSTPEQISEAESLAETEDVEAMLVVGSDNKPLFDPSNPRFVPPPPAKLHSFWRSQTGEIGGYCWGICVSPGWWPTTDRALKISRRTRLKLELPKRDVGVSHVEYSVSRVDQPVERRADDHVLLWDLSIRTTEVLAPQREQSFKLEVGPGLYVLTAFAWWEDGRDSTHGFLLQIE